MKILQSCMQLEVERSLHSSRSLNKSLSRRILIQRLTRSHSRNYSSSNQRDVSDVEAIMTDLLIAQPSLLNANIVEKRTLSQGVLKKKSEFIR